jgi:lactoylglutathione lyase
MKRGTCRADGRVNGLWGNYSFIEMRLSRYSQPCLFEKWQMSANLKLVVIRSHDLEKAVRFYTVLGLTFIREQHGNGPEHWAATAGSLTLEIYPASQAYDSSGIRIGFEVTTIESVLKQLTTMGATIHQPLRDSPWGLRAVVRDLDGHTVELVQAH